MKNPRETLESLALQLEALPKVRDALLEVVNEINVALDAKRPTRGLDKKPRKASPRKSKKRRPAKFIEALPKNATRVRGVHRHYMWVPNLGMVSCVNGKVRVLRMGTNRCFNVKDSKGELMNLGIRVLEAKLGQSVNM